MKVSTVLFLAAVPVLNIALNTAASETAAKGNSFFASLFSYGFLITFLIGSASLLCLLGLYRQNMPLGRGILLAGAASIVGGSLWGFFRSGTLPNPVEVGLIITIAAFLGFRIWLL